MPLRLSAAGLALVLGAGLAGPAFADDAASVETSAAEGQGLGDIVVTAQKRETNLQQTPIAIAVMSGEDLANRHVISLDNLQDGSIPSLRVAPFFARKSALNVSMRGVGGLSDANQPARDQGVGVYIDGVYLGRAQGLGAALYDIERMEVLKGPQGTLFGRNTEGGAISIVTKKPSGEAGFELTAGASNYGGYRVVAHADMPEVHDLSLKVDALEEKRGGTVDNPLGGQPDFNSYDKWGVHAGLLWRPSADFSALFNFDTSYDGSTPYYVQNLTDGLLVRAPLMKLQTDRAEVANVGVPMQESVGKTTGFMLNLDWHAADHLELRSISSYRRLTQSQFDNGSTALSVFVPNGNFSRYSLANFYQHQYSEELQLLGTYDEVTFVAGAFYYHEHVEDNAWTPNTNKWNATGTDYTILPTPIASTPFPDRASIAITDSYAAFGQATWTPGFLNGMVHLTLGGRYSHDEKTGQLFKVNGAAPVVPDGKGGSIVGPIPLSFNGDRFDPLVNLAVDVTKDINVYGKWSTGYKSGGANSRSLTYRPFDPESVSTFEIGTKAELFDHHVRLNLAAYTSQYKDAQIDFNLNTIVAGINRATLETVNAEGNGRIKGFEADLSIAPVAGLTLSASYAYTHVRLPEAHNPFLAGNPLVPVYALYVPENAASGSIDYKVPLARATLGFHLDGNYSDPQYTSASDPTLSDSAFLVNGRIAISDIKLGASGPTAEISVWSRNLFNEAYVFLRNGGPTPTAPKSALGAFGIYNEPRTFGADVTLRW
jgi:iron complex outermembrane receptor protein